MHISINKHIAFYSFGRSISAGITCLRCTVLSQDLPAFPGKAKERKRVSKPGGINQAIAGRRSEQKERKERGYVRRANTT